MGLTRALLDARPLRTPAYRRLWLGQTVSTVGSQMAGIAALYQLWSATGSPAWTGALGLAQAVPLVLLGLFAGGLVDRYDRRRLFLLATTGQAFCAAALAVQGFLGGLPPVALLLVVGVQTGCTAVSGPAARTFVPRLLPAEQVAAGLALNRIAFQVPMLAGPALGGVLAGAVGVGGCYLADAASFAFALYAAYRLPALPPLGEPIGPGLHGIAEGLAFLARTPVVRAALLTDLAATVLAMPVSLFPLVNAERFGDDPRTLGLFLTAMAVGGVAASLLSGTFTRLPRPGPVMVVGSLTWGLALTAFGLVRDPWAGLACLAVAGAADTLAVVSRSTLLQVATPDGLLGRVTAAEQVAGVGGPCLGDLRGGLVARFTSGTAALVSGGLLCVGAVALVTLMSPALRRPEVPARA